VKAVIIVEKKTEKKLMWVDFFCNVCRLHHPVKHLAFYWLIKKKIDSRIERARFALKHLSMMETVVN
jgi:hypothetical protein